MMKKYLPIYGILPMLIVLKRLEDSQEYEQCELIKEMIDDFNVRFTMDLPTVINTEAVDYVLNAYQEMGFASETTLINAECYADQIMAEQFPGK